MFTVVCSIDETVLFKNVKSYEFKLANVIGLKQKRFQNFDSIDFDD